MRALYDCIVVFMFLLLVLLLWSVASLRAPAPINFFLFSLFLFLRAHHKCNIEPTHYIRRCIN